jgi:hypothetical protein
MTVFFLWRNSHFKAHHEIRTKVQFLVLYFFGEKNVGRAMLESSLLNSPQQVNLRECTQLAILATLAS